MLSELTYGYQKKASLDISQFDRSQEEELKLDDDGVKNTFFQQFSRVGDLDPANERTLESDEISISPANRKLPTNIETQK